MKSKRTNRASKHYPPQLKLGDTIDGNPIIEIRDTCNGKQTWATSYVCRGPRHFPGSIVEDEVLEDMAREKATFGTD